MMKEEHAYPGHVCIRPTVGGLRSGEYTRHGRGRFVTDATHESMSQIPVCPVSMSSNASSTATVTPCR